MRLSLAMIASLSVLLALQVSSAGPDAGRKTSVGMLLSYNGAEKLLMPEAVQMEEQAKSDVSVVGRTYRFFSRFVDITPARMHEPIAAPNTPAQDAAEAPATQHEHSHGSLGSEGDRLLADLGSFRFREQRSGASRAARVARKATTRAVKASVHAATEATSAASAAAAAAQAAQRSAAAHDAAGARTAAKAAANAASAATVAAEAAKQSRFAATSLAAAVKRAPWVSMAGAHNTGHSSKAAHSAAASQDASAGSAPAPSSSSAGSASSVAADSSATKATTGSASTAELPAAAVVARSIARVR